MLKLQSILVPSDLSVNSRNAFYLARDLGSKFHAAIHVLHVTPTSGQFGAFARWLTERSGVSADLSEEHDRRIQEELERDFSGYDRIRHVVRRGAAVAEELLAYAQDCSIDLIVMGTHGHRSIEHPALGGTTGVVVRKARGPVITVRQHDDRERPFEGFRHIVAAIDFGDDSRDVLRATKHLASLYHSSISVLFVAEEHQVPVFSDTGLMTVSTLKLDEDIVSRADEALRQIDDETGASDESREHVVRQGNPAREIVAHAGEAAADLIVMGRRGHAPHEGLLLGTVTEHVVRRSTCPVFTLGSGA